MESMQLKVDEKATTPTDVELCHSYAAEFVADELGVEELPSECSYQTEALWEHPFYVNTAYDCSYRTEIDCERASQFDIDCERASQFDIDCERASQFDIDCERASQFDIDCERASQFEIDCERACDIEIDCDSTSEIEIDCDSTLSSSLDFGAYCYNVTSGLTVWPCGVDSVIMSNFLCGSKKSSSCMSGRESMYEVGIFYVRHPYLPCTFRSAV